MKKYLARSLSLELFVDVFQFFHYFLNENHNQTCVMSITIKSTQIAAPSSLFKFSATRANILDVNDQFKCLYINEPTTCTLNTTRTTDVYGFQAILPNHRVCL
jgi:hypothetical protein